MICQLQPGREAAGGEVPGLRLVEPAARDAIRDQVAAALASAALLRLGRARQAAGRVPGRLLGRRRRGGARPSGAAAGGAVRAVPRAAGRCPGRAPGDPVEGSDRRRVRRAHVLGHRGLRPAGADLHAARRGRRRAALATLDPRPGPGAGRRTRAARRGVPVADDPRPGVLRLLAGRYGGLPHQRGHRRGGDAVPRGDRRRPVPRGGRAGAAGRDRAAVDVAGPPRPARPLAPRPVSPARTSTARLPTTTSSPT